MTELTDLQLVAKEISLASQRQPQNPPVPNPAPLGLIAFGLTTALLQMKHTGITGEDDGEGVVSLTLGYAMFFGGLLQLVAGIGEIKRNNIFGYTAFCLYGGFWMSLGTVEIVQLVAPDAPSVDPEALQCMLTLVGIYTVILFVCTLRMNVTISSLFFLLSATCFLLAGGVKNSDVDKVAGWFGIVTSANAYWLATAELINATSGEEIIPLGKWSNIRAKKDNVPRVTPSEHGVDIEEGK